MGHLINPIAYRLGHSRSWEDSWFIKGIYYPEFLHSILKIRQYIYYYWTTRYMEKKGILLSHFYIYKFIKKLLIKIFLYNTDFEKYIYSFFARGVGIFSDSFYYRFKKKRKKRESFSYQKYKPDLFFLLFLYYSYFSNLKVKRNEKKKKSFFFKKKKFKNRIFISTWKNDKKFLIFNKYNNSVKGYFNGYYMNSLKESDLSVFFPLSEEAIKNKKYLNIYAYENKIKQLKKKRLNMGFLDFLEYTFFKINMLDKTNEDIIRNKKKRKSVEMILNYSFKITQWIIFLRKYMSVNLILGRKKKKRSLCNFLFFLTFIMNILKKIKKNSSRIQFKLKELNLKLIRLFFFNKTLTKFAFFYGKFLTHILYILTNIKCFYFKFCFITNNSINAKFIARYIGLKLKRKFPLFTVINPLKKEFRKLADKKKEKNKISLYSNLNIKFELNKSSFNYKKSFRSMIIYLRNKYLEKCIYYYKVYGTLITFDMYIYFFMLKKRFKYRTLLNYWKNKFLSFKYCIWKKSKKKRILNKIWIKFIIILLERKILKIDLLKKKKVLLAFFIYIKNKLFINLFFGFNKYQVDSLANIFFILKGEYNTFFFFNSNHIALTIYFFFFNYNIQSFYGLWRTNFKYLIMSNYFLKSFTFYMYVQYGFNKLIDHLKINKRNYYLKMKKLYSPSSFFLGYKMSFKGRFTRKQRASSIWFHQGFVPLNTIKGSIDYAFFTIPLKNSAISIKLWFYKNTNKMLWDSKFLSKI